MTGEPQLILVGVIGLAMLISGVGAVVTRTSPLHWIWTVPIAVTLLFMGLFMGEGGSPLGDPQALRLIFTQALIGSVLAALLVALLRRGRLP